MYNLLGILLLLGIGLWVYKMYQSRQIGTKSSWAPLPATPVATKLVAVPIEGEGAVVLPRELAEETMLLPQYGYYHYRTPYFVNKQVPCVITSWEFGDQQQFFRAASLTAEAELWDVALAFDLLGVEAPELFIQY